MLSPSVFRFVSGSKKSALGTLYVQCRVKPGASKAREGITGITTDAVELCVTAHARDGEANKAVVKLMSEVSRHSESASHGKPQGQHDHVGTVLNTSPNQILEIPKSDLEVSHGLKSRDKTIAIGRINPEENGEAVVARIEGKLRKSMNSNE